MVIYSGIDVLTFMTKEGFWYGEYDRYFGQGAGRNGRT